MRCKMQVMNLLRNKGRGMVCSCHCGDIRSDRRHRGCGRGSLTDGGERDAQTGAVVGTGRTVAVHADRVGRPIEPAASDRTAEAVEPAINPQPATDDEDRPSAGAMVLAVVGLALWVGARLRRED